MLLGGKRREKMMVRPGVRGTLPSTAVVTLLLTFIMLATSHSAAAAPVVDGEIVQDEYEYHVSFGNGHFHLYWSFLDNETIQMGIFAGASGMVAVGFDPSVRMKDADMIIGFREGAGDFELHDAWSIGQTGPHPDDADEGGTFDLMEYTIKESGGETTAEFTRKLVTGDSLDKDIPRDGKLKVIWATSDTDAFETYHTRRGTATIDMGTGRFESTEYPTLWPYHAIFMSLAMILFAATWFSVVYKKRLKKRFLEYHHIIGSVGVLSAIAGLVIGIIMVGQLDSGHVRVPHSIIASVTLVLGIATMAVGQVFISRRELKRRTRKPHIYLGGLSIVMMGVTTIVGLMYVFPV
jgi:hypothetical protein